MKIKDIDVREMAKGLLASSDYQMGGAGDFYVWLKNGPGREAPQNTAGPSEAWRKSITSAEFEECLQGTIRDSLANLPISSSNPGSLRLTRVINAALSLPDDIAAGKRDFGDCWSVN